MALISENLRSCLPFKCGVIMTKPIRSSELSKSSSEEDKMERGSWSNKLDFLFSCISLSVGLGNVWRFPYLCYKNSGGGFLITYLIAMVFCGIPIFFQEVSIGQYLGCGGMTFVGKLCPLLKGVGYSTMTIVFLLDVYYCIIIAWTILYFINTFVVLPDLPWASCDKSWINCYDGRNKSMETVNSTETLRTSVEEFFEKEILDISRGIEHIGKINWKLFGCLVLGWITIYLIIRKGLHQSGKIIWFTALCPYAILITLLVRAVTLDGAVNGLLYYITPRWSELLSTGPWMEGATQIFFAYSIGCGALPALGSYNKFNHNCYKDAVITCVVNTLTSILAGCVTFSVLGHMALEKNEDDIGNVVQSGPGLVFLTYPEVVLKLPGSPFWAAAFFFMLLLLGIDSAFCLVESFITGVVDNWSEKLRPHRNKLTICICLVMFLLGIPMITQGGVYIFQLMDYYSASGMSLLWVCFFQTIAISWVFGTEKLCECIKEMIGMYPNKFLVVCWKFFGPLVILVIFAAHCVNYESLKYGNYTYPTWTEYIGFCISLSSMLWVPGYAIYYVLTSKGTPLENLRMGLKPKFKHRIPKKTEENYVNASIEQFI